MIKLLRHLNKSSYLVVKVNENKREGKKKRLLKLGSRFFRVLEN